MTFKKLKSNTLLESLVALTILMILYFIVTTFFVQNSVIVKSKLKVKALEQMSNIFLQHDLLSEDNIVMYEDDAMCIKKEVGKYGYRLLEVKLFAVDKQGVIIVSRVKIVQGEVL